MNSQAFKHWCATYCQDGHFAKPLIMGVLNVTPDSFSDGGCYVDPGKALDHALYMIDCGADLIDIGGESTRPGACPVSEEEELARVLPIIEQLQQHSSICISIDTSNPKVMQEAVARGVSLVNDVRALDSEKTLNIVAELNVPVCLMHMRGQPKTMQTVRSFEGDILHLVEAFFQKKIQACLSAGIKKENILLDPGFGFGKSLQHNLRLVNQLAVFHEYKAPIVLGVSRKTTLGDILQKAPNERLVGGLAVAIFAALQGVAILRTHDVNETNQAFRMLHAIKNETLFLDSFDTVSNPETRN